MSGLERIILINCHLPGFVELDVSGHSNICGTNASGKTTLQRLVPVFFGELPSRVVPKTRKKFDDFYLPYANSYLIYQYTRENQQQCQVVLTRKANEGVQYRFVAAAYHSEQYLVEVEDKKGKAAQAMNKEQWLKNLRQLGIDYSHLISATSEFRSVIQNDVGSLSGRGNSKDSLKLRQMAGSFSLVSAKHRIRHMEKLVSAVHAKEGKMDTLRSMLAAIFEEDGLVQPATTVRNTKAKEWITQMRQTLRLQDLKDDFQAIESLTQVLAQTEQQLTLLKPVLTQDFASLKTQRADNQANKQDVVQQQNEAKTAFNEQESMLNSEMSAVTESLNAKSARLQNIEDRYEAYLESDMDALEKDSQALPSFREELEASQAHYNLMIDQHKDLAAKLEQQKLTLSESLNRLVEKIEKQTRELEQQKNSKRQIQNAKQDSINADYQTRREALVVEYDEKLLSFEEQRLKAALKAEQTQLTADEFDNKQLAETRLDMAQQRWQVAQQTYSSAEKQHRTAQHQTDKADDDLHDARKRVKQDQDQLASLHRQLAPEQGTLRQYLCDNVADWQMSIGKVIHSPLLERKDLSPTQAENNTATSSLFGVNISLADIDFPDYAQDEAALKNRLEQAQTRLQETETQFKTCEETFEEAYKHQQAMAENLAAKKRELSDAEQEMQYAKQSKQRLNEEHSAILKERKNQALSEVKALIEQKNALSEQKRTAIDALKSDHHSQLQEFKVGWQAELQQFDDNIDALYQQVDRKRANNKEQITQLEEAFNQTLADNDIDTAKLNEIKQKNESLSQKIHDIVNRQDELSEYKRFINLDYQQARPALLEQETELKESQRTLEQRLATLTQGYKTERAKLSQSINKLDNSIRDIGNELAEIEPLLSRLNNLVLPELDDASTKHASLGDQTERIMRVNEGLEHLRTTQDKLVKSMDTFESALIRDAGKDFLDIMQQSFDVLSDNANVRDKLPILEQLLSILSARQKQIVEQGETIGGDLNKFFIVFSDINRKIASQSKRLTEEVQDDLSLDGIAKSEVRILSSVDELNFWGPLKRFAQLFTEWQLSGDFLPNSAYLEALSDVVEVLPSQANYSIESLLRLELHLNEGGSDLVIKNDRQLLESSSHGMAYLILCKFLLAFTRLLRNQAQVHIHWPIDEIGTLAYHNVEKLFAACDKNAIHIIGAFPNPESDVLMLFKHRYLIDKQKQQLEKIEPKVSRISQRLKAAKLSEAAV